MRRSLLCVVLASGALWGVASNVGAELAKPPATAQTLIQRPDLRPTTVTLKVDYNFASGRSVKAGTELVVYAVERDGVVLDAGPFVFKADFKETDLLERAAKLIDALSEEAIATTYQTLPRTPELWPTEVTMRSEANLGTMQIPAGTVVIFNGYVGGQVQVFDTERDMLFNTAPETTDLIERARAMTETPKEQRRTFATRSLESALGIAPPKQNDDEEREPSPLAGKDFLLVVRGGSSCPRCQVFLPQLAERYAELREKYDNFEVIYVPSENNESAHTGFVDAMGTPGLIVPYKRRSAVAPWHQLPGRLLPIVHLVAPDGRVLFSAHPDGRGTTPMQVVDRLEQELQRTR